MNFPNLFPDDIKYRLGFVGVTISVLFHYNSYKLEFLLIEIVVGFVIGFFFGLVKQKFEQKKYRYPIYSALSIIFILALLFPVMGGQCMAYFPYTAENIFTGERKEFVYGGCGPRTHPWYYTTDNPSLSTLSSDEKFNQSSDIPTDVVIKWEKKGSAKKIVVSSRTGNSTIMRPNSSVTVRNPELGEKINIYAYDVKGDRVSIKWQGRPMSGRLGPDDRLTYKVNKPRLRTSLGSSETYFEQNNTYTVKYRWRSKGTVEKMVLAYMHDPNGSTKFTDFPEDQRISMTEVNQSVVIAGLKPGQEIFEYGISPGGRRKILGVHALNYPEYRY